MPHLHFQKTTGMVDISNTGVERLVTDPDLPGFQMKIPAGATIIGWDGQPNTQLSVRRVPIDRIPVPPRSLVVVWLNAALHVISLRLAAMLAATLWVLLFIALNMRMLARGGVLLRLGQSVLWPSLVAWVIVAIIFGWQVYEKSSYRYAIVLTPRVVVTSAPAEDATEVFTLHEGVRVQLETSSGSYQRIRLADGKVGWMPQEVLGQI